MATLENTSPDRPVYLLADAVSIGASSSASYQVSCAGFDWCYVEVDSDKTYTIQGIGQSGFGEDTYYNLVDDSGGLASRSAIAAGAGYGMIFPCRNFATAGVRYINGDAGASATVTVRITLAHE